MRIRKKKWAEPELAVCPYYIKSSEAMKSSWNSIFPNDNPVYLELGCGKGGFAAALALMYPQVNFIAADIKSDMLAVARRTIEAAFAAENRTPSNLRLMQMNIQNIGSFYGQGDAVDRIYINFCNPWPRLKHNKRRLTHTRQLVQYKGLLRDGGQIHFKTDDDDLFEDSLTYFNEAGFKLLYITRDLHSSGYEHNIMTEHEKMFTAEGKKIKFLIAQAEN